jgi:hypothetical protein
MQLFACYSRFAAIFLFLCLSLTKSTFAQSPSTPEERTRLVSLAHQHEANPLDPGLKNERAWAIKWLIQVPDIQVGMCPSILGDYHKYKYSTEITIQIMLSSAAFVIENPDKAKDSAAQYVAGAEGALKAYSALLQQDPKAKSKVLDEMQEKQSQGRLKDSVEEIATKTCRNPS